jgi:4-hydroxyphenylpyruvate dioxygenase
VLKKVNYTHMGLALDSLNTLALRDDPSGIAKLPDDKLFFCNWPMRLGSIPMC